jgi:hypothetical protein
MCDIAWLYERGVRDMQLARKYYQLALMLDPSNRLAATRLLHS